MLNHTMFGKQGLGPSFRRLRLSMMEVAILGSMVLVLLLTSLDALEGAQVGKGNALELAKNQGQQAFIVQRVVKEP